jgi:putative ABC transport system substrate-binding protein
VKRRKFIALGAGAAVAAVSPQAARAQQAVRVRRIGLLSGQAETDPEGRERIGAFREALAKLGWIDGRNLRIDYLWAGGGDASRANAYAAELVGLAPDLIMVNGTPALAAMQRATKTIPIVFAQVSDPVGGGFVASISRPGGNITGFTDYEYAFAVKWLELLKEIAPGIGRVAVVHQEASFLASKFLPPIEAAGPSFGVLVSRATMRDPADIAPVLDAFAAGGANGGLITLASPLTLFHREQIAVQATRQRLPAVYPYRTFALGGGLASYGVDVLDMYRGAASYVDRILKGEKPADLPVQFATRFEFVINLKAAKAIGLTMPTSMLLRASEVIE